MTERINVTLPKELLASLRARAKAEHRSLSNLLAVLLQGLLYEPPAKKMRPSFLGQAVADVARLQKPSAYATPSKRGSRRPAQPSE